MRLTSNPSGILVMVFAVVLPFKAGGCSGRTACFTVTSADLGSSGSCPNLGEANTRLVNAQCDGSIASVDGPGSLDGDLCCYPVTYVGSGSGVPCDLSGPGTAGDTTTGFSSSGFAGGGVGGFGGGTTTGTPGCVMCNAALSGAPFNTVCDPTLLANLRVCACATKCTAACDATLCFGNQPDNGCLSCLDGACASDLMLCQQN